jgi:hypothetical protein
MKNTVRAGLAGVVMLLTSAAAAQVPQALIGTWDVRGSSSRRDHEATLVVTESGGTWQNLISEIEYYVHKDACWGRKAPISVKPVSEDHFVVKLKFSEALTGCRDYKLKITLGADGTVSGHIGPYPLTFVRK